MIIKTLTSLIIALTLLVQPALAEEEYLCWGQGDVIENSYAADKVFVGKVVATRRLPPQANELGTGRTKMLFHVEQAWKGIGEDDEFINVDVEDIYRYHFELKENYLVFAFELYPGRVSIVGCPRVKPADKAQKWVRRLGSPEMAFEVSDDVDFLPEEVIREYRKVNETTEEAEKRRKRDSVIVLPSEETVTTPKPQQPVSEPKNAVPEAPVAPKPPTVTLTPDDIFASQDGVAPEAADVPKMPEMPELDVSPEIDVKVTVPDAPAPPAVEVTIPDVPNMPDVNVDVSVPDAPDVSVEVDSPEMPEMPAFPDFPEVPGEDGVVPPAAPPPVEAEVWTPEEEAESEGGPSESAQEFLRRLPPLPALPGRD